MSGDFEAGFELLRARPRGPAPPSPALREGGETREGSREQRGWIQSPSRWIQSPSRKMNFPEELREKIPDVLARAIEEQVTEIEVAERIWQIELEVPPRYVAEDLPAGALLIANNGYGDNLFL